MCPATAQERVWWSRSQDRKRGGSWRSEEWRLLRAAEGVFDALITVDQGIPYQQNLKSFQLAVVVLIAKRNKYELLKPLISKALESLESLKPGSVIRIESAQ